MAVLLERSKGANSPMDLLFNLVRKDIKKNTTITIALAVFLTLSALLMAGGLRVAGTIVSSLSGLNEVAGPPEYLQMHKGTYDEAAFLDFVKTHDYIRDALIVKMLNISNSNIIYQGETLEKSLMDNGFIVQNERFDLLLDMENQVAAVKDGEIGVPVYYAEELGIKVGDWITLHKGDYRKDLVVSTIIRDAQMNSALASSKRFLISRADLREISDYMGEWEYSFEFLLEKDTPAATLEKDYMETGMPANGVAVTGSLLTMLNSLSFGLVAFIIIAISVLLVIIALLCLSYIIRATLAEENYTIGEMKAIGFPRKDIEKLYQIKYTILVLIAGVIGFLAAIPFGDFFSSSVTRYCGDGYLKWMKWAFPLVGVVLLSVVVIVGCRRIIRKNLRSTVVELMRGEERITKEGHYFLPSKGLKYPNFTMACGELKCKWKEYSIVFLVFVISAFLILLPMNMKNTIENPSFVTYMGVGESDIRIDIQYSERLLEQRDAALSHLEQDLDVEKYAVYRLGYVQAQNKDGEWEYVRVGNGEESIFPLEYLEGRAPTNDKEIALSYLESIELGKGVGDLLTVVYRGKQLSFTVSGVYQDITYGGKTAKAAIDFAEDDVEVYIIYLDVRDGVTVEEKTNELRDILTDSKITPINEFISQTLGGITDNMRLVEGAATATSLLLSVLITIMILQLITAREHSAISIKKAIGFSNRDIRTQFAARILLVQLLGIVVGTVLANDLGEAIFGMMLSSMGASRIILLVDPVKAYIISPLAQIVVVLITVLVGTNVVRKYHIRDQIRE